MTEADIQRAVLLRASRLGWRLFRNNVGMLQDSTGRWVRYGLCTGSSDLIGWRPVVITPDMVGSTIAQFVAVEVKASKGRVTEEQQNFLRQVRGVGGCGILARSIDDLPADNID